VAKYSKAGAERGARSGRSRSGRAESGSYRNSSEPDIFPLALRRHAVVSVREVTCVVMQREALQEREAEQ